MIEVEAFATEREIMVHSWPGRMGRSTGRSALRSLTKSWAAARLLSRTSMPSSATPSALVASSHLLVLGGLDTASACQPLTPTLTTDDDGGRQPTVDRHRAGRGPSGSVRDTDLAPRSARGGRADPGVEDVGFASGRDFEFEGAALPADRVVAGASEPTSRPAAPPRRRTPAAAWSTARRLVVQHVDQPVAVIHPATSPTPPHTRAVPRVVPEPVCRSSANRAVHNWKLMADAHRFVAQAARARALSTIAVVMRAAICLYGSRPRKRA